MKFNYIFKKEEKELSIQLSSENQQESAKIVEMANRIKAPAYSYGKVSELQTWVWIMIPLKDVPFTDDYFGTRRKS